MNHILSKLMILIYGISIAGYVLMDGSHAVLHTLKSKLHHHEVDHHHSHGHHHVEDHQDIFTPNDEQNQSDSKDSVEIFSFLLFYQSTADYSVFNVVGNLKVNGLFKKLLTLTQAPLTPPPLG